MDPSKLPQSPVAQQQNSQPHVPHHPTQEELSHPPQANVPHYASPLPGGFIPAEAWLSLVIGVVVGKNLHAARTGDVAKISDTDEESVFNHARNELQGIIQSVGLFDHTECAVQYVIAVVGQKWLATSALPQRDRPVAAAVGRQALDHVACCLDTELDNFHREWKLSKNVDALVASGSCSFAWILFHEDDELVPGPQAGVPDPADRAQVPILFNADHVADLVADGCADAAFLERIALAISPHCLVGWDTGGVPWEP